MSWRRFRKRAWWDAERVREMECHLAIEIDENLARGLPPSQAVAAAYRKFGNPALIREEIYRMNTVSWFEEPLADLRYAFRVLRLNPGFFAVAALSLILGIGANAAIFQLLDSVRLRMLPVAHPEELARVKIAENAHCCSGHFSARNTDLTYAQWQQIRSLQKGFSGIFAWSDARFNLARRGEARFAEGLWVSGEFFGTLGVKPLIGRLITAGDDHPGCGLSGAVISYGFWQREFGGDRHILGKIFSADGHALSVIGVTPPAFFGLEVGRNFDFALPLCAEPVMDGEGVRMNNKIDWWLSVNGRLKAGWTAIRARAQMQAISPAVFEASIPPHLSPENEKYWRGYKLTTEPAGSGVSSLRRDYDQPLVFMLATAGLVLIIACANLANLMLARASVREREMAIRLAIGAGKGRLIRQMFAESLVLAAIGVAGGIAVAELLSRYLTSFLGGEQDHVFLDLKPDWPVLSFTAGVGLLTCLIFGLYPALKAAQIAPIAALRNSGRSVTAGRERFGFRRLLVISQVSLSLVLLVGALLFVGTLHKLMTLDAGFRENGLLIAVIDLSQSKFPVNRRAAVYRNLLEDVRRTPGVDSAAAARMVPVGGSFWNEYIQMLGRSKPESIIPMFNSFSSGFFRTMGSRLIAGRDFDERDTPTSPEVAIVNEQFSRKILGGANPLGKQFKVVVGPGEPEHLYQIVGIVQDMKYSSLRKDFEPQVYVADSQEKEPGLGVTIMVRSAAPLGVLMPRLERTIMNANPLAALQFRSFKAQLSDSLQRERLMAALSALFGMLAAVLASVGLYGVISYMVARRRNEIGIRVALGAARGAIVRLVLREAGVLLVAGIAIGILLSIAAAQTAKSLLYGLQPTDPVTIESAVTLLAVVALVATLIPAIRAARLDPMAALREE